MIVSQVQQDLRHTTCVYTLKYKEADAVLRGDKQEDGSYGYEQPVDFWMPFNGGIGLHDASWRSSLVEPFIKRMVLMDV